MNLYGGKLSDTINIVIYHNVDAVPGRKWIINISDIDTNFDLELIKAPIVRLDELPDDCTYVFGLPIASNNIPAYVAVLKFLQTIGVITNNNDYQIFHDQYVAAHDSDEPISSSSPEPKRLLGDKLLAVQLNNRKFLAGCPDTIEQVLDISRLNVDGLGARTISKDRVGANRIYNIPGLPIVSSSRQNIKLTKELLRV